MWKKNHVSGDNWTKKSFKIASVAMTPEQWDHGVERIGYGGLLELCGE